MFDDPASREARRQVLRGAAWRLLSYASPIDTLTFLFTDIEGSTALLRRLGDDAYAKVLDVHHRLIRSGLATHGGKEEGTQGDSFFALFSSSSACVAAALEMQQALAAYVWPAGEELRVRMGVHTGEASETSTGLVGYEVHRAARIAAVAHGGQVLLSSAAAGLVEDLLPPEVALRDLGAHRLKDLGRPEVLFQLIGPGLRPDFPPLRSLDNPELPNNLPTSLSPFIGRAAELAEVRALILGSRLVTLTGAGGAGKTRLALQVAAELLDGSSEGVWLVELAPITDPDLVPTAVAEALQLRLEADRPPLESLLHALRNQNVLITLDNCEHLIDAVAKLADLVGRSCPRVSLVATSREPLGVDGEQVYRVRSLSLPSGEVQGVGDLAGSDAVDLFMARARLQESTFALEDSDAPVVASICRRLDGIPLAIELATARLATMSLGDLDRRLDHRFRLLTGGSRNALPRHQTLGATVAWSYDLLNGPEREALRRLSVFVGGLDLDAAEAVCATEGIESFEIVDLLGSLVNKSLVTAERGLTTLRYRLLETIRQYAADQLVQVGGETEALEARSLHASYYLRLCEQAAADQTGPQQGTWLKRLDVEWDNLQAALVTLASDPARTEEVLRLGVAGSSFFTSRAHQTPIAVLREALVRDVEVPRQLRAKALLATGILILMTAVGEQRHETVRELCGEALELARAMGDRPLEAEALAWLAYNSDALEGRELRRAQGEEALELARQIEDPRLIGLALTVLGLMETGAAQRVLLLEALSNLRQSGDLIQVCSVMIPLSIAWTDIDAVRAGRELAEEAMELAEELGATHQLEYLWSNNAVYCYILGDVEAAERYGRRSLLSARRLGRPMDECVWNFFVLACCATSNGEYARAAQLTGAHDALDARLPASDRGFWPPIELEMRDNNRARLLEALGEEEFGRATAVGRELALDKVADLALGRVVPTT